MHGAMFKNLYFNFSGKYPENSASSLSFEETLDQNEESIWEESEFSLSKLNVFEFSGKSELTARQVINAAAAECAWPELLYRKLVLGFLGMVFVAFLVNVF